jgi:hypothetical protein
MMVMRRPSPRLIIFALAAMPFVIMGAQGTAQQDPPCEQVFKNIQVFKGVPSSDLIPSMEFMAASLKVECSDCHDAKDYSADTRMKGAARHMVTMQRDINAKNFGGRNQVTCMTCHGGKEQPQGTPLAEGITLRHTRIDSPPKAEDLFAKHITTAGNVPGALVRAGTLTAPNDATHKVETKPLEFIQAPGGKFRLVAGERRVGSDGTQTWYGAQAMGGEAVAIFGRIGRAWRGDDAFAGLDRTSIAGKDIVGKTPVVVVRANRASTTSTEELSFDTRSNLLARLVNARRSSIGTVVTAIDYTNYKKVEGLQVPMKVVMTFAGGEQWIMDFKSAKVDPSVPGTAFKVGG